MKKANSVKRDLRPTLVFLNGDLLAVPVPLEREKVVLGRAVAADVRLNDSKVSRRHATIQTITNTENGTSEYIITDLESRNGTLLNGEKITQETLQNGDKINIGDYLLRFELLDDIDREYHLQIRRLLSHDDLTGLLSSRSFFSELLRETKRARQEKRIFCVLMMDVDFFKTVNDTYGHLTGSKNLEEIAFCITETLRTGDTAARFGGEEFAAFLLDAELAQGLIAADRIRAEIENYPFSIIKRGKSTETHHVTISIGVAVFPKDSRDPIELVEMADAALYRAKREGRNRVCAYQDLTDEETQKILPPRRD